MKKIVLLVLVITSSLSSTFCQSNKNGIIWIKDVNIALSKPHSVYYLDLSNMEYNNIPNFISKFVNLRSLNLSNNNISTIDDVFSPLLKLESIDLSRNNIESINFSVFKSQRNSLIELWIRDNNLTNIDSTINILKYLSILEIGRNEINRIGNNVELKRITKLGLDGNLLKEMPLAIYKCSKIINLNLNENLIEKIVLNKNIRNIKRLNIGNNPIINFEIKAHKSKLQYLILDWIKIEDSWLLNLPISLKYLSMEHCGLSDLKNISHLKKLEELSVMYNELGFISKKLLPDFKNLKKLWTKGNSL